MHSLSRTLSSSGKGHPSECNSNSCGSGVLVSGTGIGVMDASE